MADQTGAVDLEALKRLTWAETRTRWPAIIAALERIPKLDEGMDRLAEALLPWSLEIGESVFDMAVRLLERIPELEREVKDLALARNAAKFWRDRAERVEAAARRSEDWEHAYHCGELGPQVATRACTCGLDKFRAALTPTPKGSANECPRCGSPKPELHPAVQADGGEVSPCGHPFHASTPEGARALAKLPPEILAPAPGEEGK